MAFAYWKLPCPMEVIPKGSLGILIRDGGVCDVMKSHAVIPRGMQGVLLAPDELFGIWLDDCPDDAADEAMGRVLVMRVAADIFVASDLVRFLEIDFAEPYVTWSDTGLAVRCRKHTEPRHEDRSSTDVETIRAALKPLGLYVERVDQVTRAQYLASRPRPAVQAAEGSAEAPVSTGGSPALSDGERAALVNHGLTGWPTTLEERGRFQLRLLDVISEQYQTLDSVGRSTYAPGGMRRRWNQTMDFVRALRTRFGCHAAGLRDRVPDERTIRSALTLLVSLDTAISLQSSDHELLETFDNHLRNDTRPILDRLLDQTR